MRAFVALTAWAMKRKIQIVGGNAMSLMQCRECRKPISSSAKMCPSCGYVIRQTTAFDWTWGRITLLVLVLVIAGAAAGLWYSSQSDKKLKEQERAAQRGIDEINAIIDSP